MLSLDPDLHKQLVIHAARHGVSLNKYCTQHLEQVCYQCYPYYYRTSKIIAMMHIS